MQTRIPFELAQRLVKLALVARASGGNFEATHDLICILAGMEAGTFQYLREAEPEFMGDLEWLATPDSPRPAVLGSAGALRELVDKTWQTLS